MRFFYKRKGFNDVHAIKFTNIVGFRFVLQINETHEGMKDLLSKDQVVLDIVRFRDINGNIF